MRNLVGWSDHTVEYPGRFELQELGNGLVLLVPSPGKVKKQGTPQNATNFNVMDFAALEAMLMAAENTRNIRQIVNTVDGLVGEKIQLTLTSSQRYPHNNSKKTVQLPESRNTTDYIVECEAVSYTGGAVGEFVITDKLLNGFKVAFTGSAKSVVVNCYVKGGV